MGVGEMGRGEGEERKERGFFPEQQQQETPPKSFFDVIIRSYKDPSKT